MKSTALLICVFLFCLSGVAQQLPTNVDMAATMTVDFTSSKRMDVLSSMAEVYGLKLEAPEKFPGDEKLGDFRLLDVHWNEIFDLVLAGTGYGFRVEGKVVTIEPGSTDYRAVQLLLKQLHREKIKGIALYRLVKIEDPVRREDFRKRLAEIMAKDDWIDEDLMAEMKEIKPNKALVPTVTAVTPAADAPVAPAATAAHL